MSVSAAATGGKPSTAIVSVYGLMGSGKTAVMNAILNGKKPETPAEMESNTPTKSVSKILIDDVEYSFLLQDVSGHERFESLAPLMLRSSNIVFLTFRLDQPDHARKVIYATDMMLTQFPEPRLIVFLGTHADVIPPENRVQDVAKFAAEHHLPYHEICAHDDGKVHEILLETLENWFELRRTGDDV